MLRSSSILQLNYLHSHFVFLMLSFSEGFEFALAYLFSITDRCDEL